MKINEKYIKISAAAIVVAGDIDLGKEVLVTVKGTVTDSRDKDNQDGTYDRYYTVKGELAVVGEAGE